MYLPIEGRANFYALVQSNLLNERAFDFATRAFLKFYHSVTPKHRRRIYFVLLDPNSERESHIERLNSKLDNSDQIFLPLKSLQIKDLEAIKRQETILFHPSITVNEMTRIELLSQCLPILTYDSWERAHSFDQASCIYLPSSLEEQSAREFGALLRDIYFDPGALKLLKDRALRHRRSAAMRENVMA